MLRSLAGCPIVWVIRPAPRPKSIRKLVAEPGCRARHTRPLSKTEVNSKLVADRCLLLELSFWDANAESPTHGGCPEAYTQQATLRHNQTASAKLISKKVLEGLRKSMRERVCAVGCAQDCQVGQCSLGYNMPEARVEHKACEMVGDFRQMRLINRSSAAVNATSVQVPGRLSLSV